MSPPNFGVIPLFALILCVDYLSSTLVNPRVSNTLLSGVLVVVPIGAVLGEGCVQQLAAFRLL